eukprot:218508_1
MATHQPYEHAKIILKNDQSSSGTEVLTIRLPKGDWQKKLQRINKKIHKEWTITQYSFSVKQNDSHVTMPKDDANKMNDIMCTLSPTVTLNIIPEPSTSNNNDDVKTNEQYTLVFRYEKTEFQFPIDKGFDPNNEQMFQSILNEIRANLHLNGTIRLFDEEGCDISVMEDIQIGCEATDCESLCLTVKCTPNDDIEVDDHPQHQQQTADDSKSSYFTTDNAPIVVKCMKDCQSNKTHEFVQFHRNIKNEIIDKQYRCDLNRIPIRSDRLTGVLTHLNTARPLRETDYHNLSTDYKDNTQFRK